MPAEGTFHKTLLLVFSCESTHYIPLDIGLASTLFEGINKNSYTGLTKQHKIWYSLVIMSPTHQTNIVRKYKMAKKAGKQVAKLRRKAVEQKKAGYITL